MLQNILKKILQKKYRFILFIIIVIAIIAGVYFYKQPIEYFEDENFNLKHIKPGLLYS